MTARIIHFPVRTRAPDPVVDLAFELAAHPGMVAMELGAPCVTEFWLTPSRARELAAQLVVMAEVADQRRGERG